MVKVGSTATTYYQLVADRGLVVMGMKPVQIFPLASSTRLKSFGDYDVRHSQIVVRCLDRPGLSQSVVLRYMMYENEKRLLGGRDRPKEIMLCTRKTHNHGVMLTESVYVTEGKDIRQGAGPYIEDADWTGFQAVDQFGFGGIGSPRSRSF